jgi:hypothetical protein
MNREELLQMHGCMCTKALELMKRKNHDYSGANGDDPFANFRRVEAMGICSTERGFLVRMSDKLSRLSTFCESGKLLVADEGVEDTLIDLINYSVLLAGYISSTAQPPKADAVPQLPLIRVDLGHLPCNQFTRMIDDRNKCIRCGCSKIAHTPLGE